MKEVKRLRQELSLAAERLGYEGLDVEKFLDQLRNEKSQQFSSKNETLAFLMKLLKKINSKLGLVFPPDLIRPEVLDVNVKMAPDIGGPLAYYSEASVDGRRKGTFYIDLENLASWKIYDAMTLTLHEANPGHNLQVRGILCFDACPQILRSREEYKRQLPEHS